MITSDIPRLSLKQQQHAQQTQQRNQLSTAAISWAEVSRRADKCREECQQLLNPNGRAPSRLNKLEAAGHLVFYDTKVRRVHQGWIRFTKVQKSHAYFVLRHLHG